MVQPGASCVFCAIARGEVAASIVVREGGLCAFLDARPVFKGHVLIIPELHVHVVPRTKGDGLRGFWPRVRYGSDVERGELAARIAAALR